MANRQSNYFDSNAQTSHQARTLWIYSLSLILAIWLGATILLDFVVMPSLSTAGMMNSTDFIPAGFSIFHRFNAAELIAGSMLFTGAMLLLSQTQISHRIRFGVVSGLLFVIPIVYFYYLSPQMAGLGLAVDPTEAIPPTMNSMHMAYWVLDILKLSCVALYLSELWNSFGRSANA